MVMARSMLAGAKQERPSELITSYSHHVFPSRTPMGGYSQGRPQLVQCQLVMMRQTPRENVICLPHLDIPQLPLRFYPQNKFGC